MKKNGEWKPVVRQMGDGLFLVGSERDPAVVYEVRLGEMNTCTCPAGARGVSCKHVRACVELANGKEGAHGEVAEKQLTLFELGEEEKEKPTVQKTKNGNDLHGYEFGEVTSALQKEIRAGNVEESVFWGLLLYERAPYYAWKRLLVIAAEDVGFGDVEAVQLAYSLAAGWEMSKAHNYAVSGHAFTMAVMALAKANKSTRVEDLQSLTMEKIKAGVRLPIKSRYLDGHTKAGRANGATWDRWYADRHGTCRIPTNKYVRELWKLKPEWKPEETFDVPDEDEGDDIEDDETPF